MLFLMNKFPKNKRKKSQKKLKKCKNSRKNLNSQNNHLNNNKNKRENKVKKSHTIQKSNAIAMFIALSINLRLILTKWWQVFPNQKNFSRELVKFNQKKCSLKVSNNWTRFTSILTKTKSSKKK